MAAIYEDTKTQYEDLGNGLARAFVTGADAPAQEVHGVDISVWQGVVDWEKLASKVQFAYIRAGYGNSYIDPQLAANVAGAAANDVPYGLYWFLKPDKDWRKHAQSFADVIGQYGGKLYPVIDLEDRGGLDKNALDSWVKKLLDELMRLVGLDLVEIGCYTSAGFLNSAMPLTNYLKWSKLWVAHWTTAATPLLPNEWAVPGRTWKFWQYSAKGDGLAYGVQSRNIDLDRYNGSLAQFEDEFQVTLPEPEPDPLPEPAPYLKRVQVVGNIDWLNVRAQPDIQAADLGDLKVGSIVPVVEEYGDWYRLAGGWIHKGFTQDV